MNTSDIVAIDTSITIWNRSANQPDALPQSAQLACSYWLNVIIGEVEEQLYFNRTRSYDSLWTYHADFGKARLAIKSHLAGTVQAAAERLFRKLSRARRGFEGPSGFINAGLIDRATYDQALQELKEGFKRNR